MLRDIDYLLAHEVHVWKFDLDGSAYDEHLLSEDERERAKKFVRPDDQCRFKAAHVSVRQILGRYLNEPPLSLVFGASITGKPFLKAPSRPSCTAFNLAHSAQYGLLALTRDRDVGVDIEIERDLTDLTGIARQIMSPTEFQCFESTAAHLAGEAFFGLWTRKEALLKAIGTGFSTDPRELHLGLENREATVAFRGTIWSVASLGALLPLQAAFAVSGELPDFRIFQTNSTPV